MELRSAGRCGIAEQPVYTDNHTRRERQGCAEQCAERSRADF